MEKTTSVTDPKEDAMSAVFFKAHCLRVMDEVAARRRPVTITKHGKPIARLVPIEAAPSAGFVGTAAGLVLHAERLDEPTGEHWEVEG